MAPSILSHAGRKKRIQIFTLDPAFSNDVYDRVRTDPRMRKVEIIQSQRIYEKPEYAMIELDTMAERAVRSKLFILDVRSYTLPRLQQIYNKLMGLNRRDMNNRCFTICVGDGPMGFLNNAQPVEMFSSMIAKLRIDFSAALYFYDPFMHYTVEDTGPGGFHTDTFVIPTKLPQRFSRAFKEKEITVTDVRKFFRAANIEDEDKMFAARELRGKKLEEIFRASIKQLFPQIAEEFEPWFTVTGMSVPGESLRLNMYPFFFEDWVFDLIDRRAKVDELSR